MKLIYFLLITTASIYAQPNVNVLSEDEFESIQINGHSISQIRSTNGNEAYIINLFGTPADKKITSKPEKSYGYYYNGFSLNFSSYISETSEPILGSFEIVNSNFELSVKGVNFSVGDNISVLSPLNLEKNTAGNYSSRIETFLIAPCESSTHYLYIRYDINSQEILKIGYIERT